MLAYGEYKTKLFPSRFAWSINKAIRIITSKTKSEAWDLSRGKTQMIDFAKAVPADNI